MKVRLANPLTRVEGHSELIITQKRDNQVEVAYRLPSTRDFQNILIGQHIQDLPKIVTRICGICPISHRIGALKALETAFEVKIPHVAELLRELAFLGEIIRSHTYSVFFSTLPDLMHLANQVSRQDIIGVDKTQSRVLPVAIKLYRAAEKLVTETAGNTNMAYNLILGGVRNNITLDQQQQLVNTLHTLLPDIKWAKEFYLWLLNEIEGEIHHFILPKPLFISSFDTNNNRFSGTDYVTLFTHEQPVHTFSPQDLSHQLRERTQPEFPTSIAYTSFQYPKLRFLAGPHARLAALQTKTTNKQASIGIPNLFYAGLLRLDEIEFSVINALRLLESEWNIAGNLSTHWQSQPVTGASAVEAPRGSLLYHLEVSDKQTIKALQIVVPTELNLLALTEITKNIVSTCLDLGWTVNQTMERAQMGIRCFDPCVSCATNTDIRFRESPVIH
ncbi:MAG: nickel-dependent hydrogenase large subunit [Promethearchaeota archaeon]